MPSGETSAFNLPLTSVVPSAAAPSEGAGRGVINAPGTSSAIANWPARTLMESSPQASKRKHSWPVEYSSTGPLLSRIVVPFRM